MTTYADVGYRADGKTVVNKKTGQDYGTNEALAADLGIAPHQIDWKQVAADSPVPTAASATPVVKRYDFSNTSPIAKEKTDYYSGLDRTPVTEETKTSIRDNIAKQMQDRIDAINESYNNLVSQENKAGEGRMGQTRAMGSRAGLLGSPMGAANMDKMDTYNKEKVSLINDKRNNDINAIWDKIDSRADEAIKAKEDAVNKNIQDYFSYSDEQIKEAQQNLIDIASTGADLNSLSSEDRKKLMEQTGYSDIVLDSKWNAAQAGTTTFHTIKKSDGSEALLGITQRPDGTISQKEYDVSTGGAVVKTYDGVPYVETRDEITGKVTLEPVEGFQGKQSSSYVEWQNYKAEQEKAGAKAMDYNAYMNMDANRKAVKTTINYSASKDAKQSAAQSTVTAILEASKGIDEKVAPIDYQKAKNAWMADGYGSDDFDNIFSGYIDQSHAADYSVKWKGASDLSSRSKG